MKSFILTFSKWKPLLDRLKLEIWGKSGTKTWLTALFKPVLWPIHSISKIWNEQVLFIKFFNVERCIWNSYLFSITWVFAIEPKQRDHYLWSIRVTVMLVTLWWWPIWDVGGFFRYVGDFSNVFNWSPTSQTFHQHIWSPTSVTNINETSISHYKSIIIQNYELNSEQQCVTGCSKFKTHILQKTQKCFYIWNLGKYHRYIECKVWDSVWNFGFKSAFISLELLEIIPCKYSNKIEEQIKIKLWTYLAFKLFWHPSVPV